LGLDTVDLGDLFLASREGLVDLRKADGCVATEQERNDAHNDAADRQHAVIFARNGIHGEKLSAEQRAIPRARQAEIINIPLCRKSGG